MWAGAAAGEEKSKSKTNRTIKRAKAKKGASIITAYWSE